MPPNLQAETRQPWAKTPKSGSPLVTHRVKKANDTHTYQLREGDNTTSLGDWYPATDLRTSPFYTNFASRWAWMMCITLTTSPQICTPSSMQHTLMTMSDLPVTLIDTIDLRPR
jgi:hypothetical protein